MSIEKYVEASFTVSDTFDSVVKTANWTPETYVPEKIANFVAGLQPDPRFVYLHTIGMSDGDSYGSNLNGDVFTTEELTGLQSTDEAMKNPGDNRGVPMPRYQTFEDAKFFRHHDNTPASKFYGDIPCAAWNDVMRRVEMIVRIAKAAIPEMGMEGAPDIVAKLDHRGYLSVSMGCRIANEQCTYCGAQNEFVSQRCNHMKKHMNEIMPNGVKVAAINYGVRFFDLSDVTIPADPIANSLAKVASIHTVKEANMAKDIEDKLSAWMAKRSEMEKMVPPVGAISECVPYKSDTHVTDVEEYSGDELQEAAKRASYDLETVLSTATLAGVVLSPDELFAVTQHCEPATKVAEDLNGFRDIPLDKFSLSVYDALQSKIATRSGFVAHCPAAKWEPVKIAETGGQTKAAYYGFYRASLGMLPRSTFVKVAHRIPVVRELHEGKSSFVDAGLYALAHAGLDAPF